MVSVGQITLCTLCSQFPSIVLLHVSFLFPISLLPSWLSWLQQQNPSCGYSSTLSALLLWHSEDEQKSADAKVMKGSCKVSHFVLGFLFSLLWLSNKLP